MERINPEVFTRRLREVVADEPKAFAYDIGVSLSAVYNYLNGRVPTTDVLFRIARYSGKPMEWFLADDTVPATGDVVVGGAGIAPAVSYAAAGRR
jgi:hypothetical protein